MNDLISVIIPVYKVEEYLCRCVDSVLAQTYGNLEIILVDDGSPDGCPAMCDAYAGQDARIRVIHQENAGLSGARNAGIDAARGQWLAFVDSDDYLAPDFLECLYRACVDTGSELSVCRWIYVRGEAVDVYKRQVFIRKTRIERVFLFTILCLGVLYNFLITPYMTPDESYHIDMTYRQSNTLLGIESAGENKCYKRCLLYTSRCV